MSQAVMADEKEGDQLNPSKLGTKAYWDKAYDCETENFRTNPSDEGVIWFEESGAEDRIAKYLEEELQIPLDASFVDVGTGNGHLLFTLREENEYHGGKMLGIDYSEKGVELAKEIARLRGLEKEVEFECVDVIKDDVQKWAGDGFDVVLDKGTFDAISLSDELLEDGRRIAAGYAEKVAQAVKPGKWFIITSCNWTEEELKEKLGCVGGLEYYGSIKYPSFTFGGKQGQAISSVCFKRS
ncbi:S-adenosyl-L-methionine-dependent methyltransferase [Kalaharituber pfeilii]|nr:S-adenosyl-L-methionine-dependent methyltransferase [Kalaharituber pfeilii]